MKWALWLILLMANIALAQKQVSYLAMTEPIKSNTPLTVSAGSAVNANVPFEVKNGMIVLQGVLNGKKGCFILDTGAPRLVVNQQGREGAAQGANSCNGSFSVFLVDVKQFSWAGGEHRNLQAIALDLSHLERELKCRLLGIIGYEEIKGFELLLDYRKFQLMLFNPDGGRLHRVATPDFIFPFDMESHLPVITLQAGHRSLRFGLDTGAEGNLVDQQALHGLSTRTIREEELRGLDQTVRLVPVVRLQQLITGSLEFDHLLFLATDFGHIREKDGIAIDGLLGFPFFENAIVSINYARQKLFIWNASQENF